MFGQFPTLNFGLAHFTSQPVSYANCVNLKVNIWIAEKVQEVGPGMSQKHNYEI